MNPKFSIFIDQAEEYRWRLVAANGEIVAQSEGYSTKQHAMETATRIKEIAHAANIEDETGE